MLSCNDHNAISHTAQAGLPTIVISGLSWSEQDADFWIACIQYGIGVPSYLKKLPVSSVVKLAMIFSTASTDWCGVRDIDCIAGLSRRELLHMSWQEMKQATWCSTCLAQQTLAQRALQNTAARVHMPGGCLWSLHNQQNERQPGQDILARRANLTWWMLSPFQ